MRDEAVIKLLKLVAKYDDCDIHWDFLDYELRFWINCGDIFYWACADSEEITEDTIDELEQACEDTKNNYGDVLYCCRRRGMRPQGAVYKNIDKDLWPLFDACGPEREIDAFNPCEPGERVGEKSA